MAKRAKTSNAQANSTKKTKMSTSPSSKQNTGTSTEKEIDTMRQNTTELLLSLGSKNFSIGLIPQRYKDYYRSNLDYKAAGCSTLKSFLNMHIPLRIEYTNNGNNVFVPKNQSPLALTEKTTAQGNLFGEDHRPTQSIPLGKKQKQQDLVPDVSQYISEYQG